MHNSAETKGGGRDSRDGSERRDRKVINGERQREGEKLVGENASAEKPTDRRTKRDGRGIEGVVVIEQEEEEGKTKDKVQPELSMPSSSLSSPSLP